MPVPKEKLYTVADIYALPEGQRAELIDGVIYDMAPPSLKHERIVSYLHGRSIVTYRTMAESVRCSVQIWASRLQKMTWITLSRMYR